MRFSRGESVDITVKICDECMKKPIDVEKGTITVCKKCSRITEKNTESIYTKIDRIEHTVNRILDYLNKDHAVDHAEYYKAMDRINKNSGAMW